MNTSILYGSFSRTIRCNVPSRFPAVKSVAYMSTRASTTKEQTKSADTKSPVEQVEKKAKKTMAQLDEELRQKMEGSAGDGGEAGLELEDGKPVSMKRGVRENMFRYI
jgi:hypothetical protein